LCQVSTENLSTCQVGQCMQHAVDVVSTRQLRWYHTANAGCRTGVTLHAPCICFHVRCLGSVRAIVPQGLHAPVRILPATHCVVTTPACLAQQWQPCHAAAHAINSRCSAYGTYCWPLLHMHALTSTAVPPGVLGEPHGQTRPMCAHVCGSVHCRSR